MDLIINISGLLWKYTWLRDVIQNENIYTYIKIEGRTSGIDANIFSPCFVLEQSFPHMHMFSICCYGATTHTGFSFQHTLGEQVDLVLIWSSYFAADVFSRLHPMLPCWTVFRHRFSKICWEPPLRFFSFFQLNFSCFISLVSSHQQQIIISS